MEKKIRIMHLIPSLGLGGAEKVLLALSRGIDRDKYALMVAYWGDNETLLEQFRTAGTEVVKLDLNKVVSIDSVKKVSDLLRKFSADIIHTHFIDAHLLGYLAALLSGVPSVVHIHSYPFPSKMTHRARYRLMSMTTSVFICVSDAVRKYLIHDVGISPVKTTVVYNGTDLPENFGKKSDEEKRSIRGSFGIGERSRVVGNVSRLVKCKGHECLIRAMPHIVKKYDDVRCLIVGGGVLLEELKSLAMELGVADKVIFSGERNDVESLLSIMDVFAYPTLDEGMGIAVLEAMWAQKPISASRYTAIPELIEDGKEGILVNPRDPEALAGAVLKLLHNTEYSEKIALAAKERAGKFSNLAMVKNMEKVYRRMISGKRTIKGTVPSEDGRVNVLYVHNKKDISGGERSLLNLWKNLDRGKFAAYALLPSEGELSRLAKDRGVEVGMWNAPKFSFPDIFGVLPAVLGLCRYMGRHNIDVVHSYSPRNNVLASIAGKLLGIPVIWHERNLIFGSERDVTRALLILADAVICNSMAVAERFRVKGAIPIKVKIILNGVDLSEFSPEAAARSLKRELGASGRKVVGIITNLNKRKRVEYFLEAAALIIKKYRDVLFVVVGGEFSDEASGRTGEL
ncbi:MAG: glycosyltransferase, partial [Candidatus Omnitrophica bacterium]|nr:glycosyltransferase [Candidatus Omnitrophota bacterium]